MLTVKEAGTLIDRGDRAARLGRVFVLTGCLSIAGLGPIPAQAASFTEHANIALEVPRTDKFGEPTGATAAVGGEAVAIFDANRDGNDDVVIVSADTYYSIVLNLEDAGGTHTFVPQLPVYIGVRGDQKNNRPSGLGLHDFNDDGLLDLYLTNAGKGGIRLRNPRPPFDLSASNQIDSGLYRDAGYRTHLSQGDGTFLNADLNADGDGNTRAAVFADFDADGHADMFLSNAPYFGIWWGGSSAPNQLRAGLPDGRFGPDIIDAAVINNPGDLWHDALGRANKDFKGIVVRDFDDDGKPDVILSAFSDIWDNVQIPPIWTMDPSGAQVDADNDGVPDGGYQGDWRRGLLVLRNVSTPGQVRFEDVSATAIDNALGVTDQMHTYVSVPADIDNDGDLDLLCSGPRYFFAHNSLLYGTDRVRVYRNDSVPGSIVFTNVTATSGVAFMNDDADLAAFTGGLYPISIPNIMLDGSALEMTPLLSAAAALDIDNDGDVDWVAIDRQLLARNPLTNAEFSAWVFRNDGTGRFTGVPSPEHGLIHTGRDLSYADLDRDGRLDLVIVNDSGGGQAVDNTNYVYLNAIESQNHWARVTVSEPGSRLGLGTKVTVFAAGTTSILGYDEVRTDFAYRSKRPAAFQFGLGAVDRIDVRLVPPGGTAVQWYGLASDRAYDFRLGVAAACGNGQLEAGEQCDDGNGESGDCCGATCQFEVGPCDDGDACSAGDTCDGAGRCTAGPPRECDDDNRCTADTCDSVTGCVNTAAVATGCRAAGKSLLLLKHNADDAKEQLVWKWLKGEETIPGDFGVPTETTSYTLCLYAGTAAVSIDMPAGAKWRAAGAKGFTFTDPSGTPDGAQKAVLKSGASGKARVRVKGKGDNLPDAVASVLPLPVTVQLVNDANAVCFDGSYDVDSVTRNDAKQFKAKLP